MFIPLQLNLPLLVGGAIAWFVSSRSKDKETNEARSEKGTLIASGFIAGGALMGVVSAILKFAGADFTIKNETWANTFAEPVSLIPYIALMAFMIWMILKKKKQVSE